MSLLLQLAFGELVGAGIAIIIMVVILVSAIRIVREYERAIVFRLGRLIGAKGPGLVFLVPIVDKAVKVDLRVVTLNVPKQKIITLDNVTVDVDAVVYLRVNEPNNAIIRVNDYLLASSLLAQTTLRDLIGQVTFDDILSKREELNKRMQEVLDAATDPWGVKVTSVAIRDVSLPENMHRAIAKQAEAEREKRGRIIIAEGELKAAEKMSQAANFYTQNMAAMRLRELQTWTEIARERNMVVVTGARDSEDLSTLFGILKQRLPGQQPTTEQWSSEEDVRRMIRQELARLARGEAGTEDKGGRREEIAGA
ncbi:MAG: slipin family protein [Nitrososphaera sp.]|uniref:Stomatin-like protein n=1 Tax=Nitrososphaera gargensis (strain Ga9.2) TaxID=1237085 RepID=K0ILB8_NITGG|nr:slipin family protein [Candidatus Nitrososphaera gargensis]AFU60303.1 stomatin-like protein [Candidatus Nitrososphaera gargensis Ga9.2]